ncbi:GNAT family N-acetyltransferase [Bradyrhizobium sp. sGM-13]|uniref:GNAT family N-acetyltransferase n=1 Tax=Bradyrhizobium sp. sGM-13 TaxID=2831781 RepID=UPI001BD0744F|nr:GNAT family N-acetyltransferase [Bradyrhizobium sp. sGM-13]
MIRYQTEHLSLVPPQPQHEAELLKLHNDPLVQKMIFNDVPQTSEDVRMWLDWFFVQWRKNGYGDWMVYEATNDGPTFIGRCGLRDYESTDSLELAIALCEYGRGRGLNVEASHFAIRHALGNSTKSRVVALIKPGNARSESGARKLGLRYVDDRWHNGKFLRYYEMTREEYFSRYAPGSQKKRHC